MAFVVVGTWESSRSDRVAHQETVHDDRLKPKYDAISLIWYTDGTALRVETYDLLHPPQKLGCKKLLDEAIAKGKTGSFGVRDL